MILHATEEFELQHLDGPEAARAFVRDPALALAKVRFLRGLKADATSVSGELVVPIPVLGEVDLPFESALEQTEDGARLLPCPLDHERAWVEVSGAARVHGDLMHFQFDFKAHLALPAAEGWGGAAFEKMVQAAASRTLTRIGNSLPTSMQAALTGS